MTRSEAEAITTLREQFGLALCPGADWLSVDGSYLMTLRSFRFFRPLLASQTSVRFPVDSLCLYGGRRHVRVVAHCPEPDYVAVTPGVDGEAVTAVPVTVLTPIREDATDEQPVVPDVRAVAPVRPRRPRQRRRDV